MPRGEPGKGPRPARWWMRHEGRVIEVWAVTKSDARARLKELLGLERLPPGVKVRRAAQD